MTPEPVFRYEVEESEDQFKLKLVTIRCYGRLVSETAGQLKEVVSPLIAQGGCSIVLDFKNLAFVDSSGLGTLVGLKVSAVNKGLMKLEVVNLTPRILELFRMTRLTELFAK